MNKLLHSGMALALAIGAGACAHYTLQVPEPNPAGQTWSKTYVSYLWGAYEEEKVARQCDVTQALDTVRAKDNLAYDLISVLTLGAVKPLKIEYSCSAGRAVVGEPISGL